MPWDKFSGGNSSFAAQFMRTTVAKIKGGGGVPNAITLPHLFTWPQGSTHPANDSTNWSVVDMSWSGSVPANINNLGVSTKADWNPYSGGIAPGVPPALSDRHIEWTGTVSDKAVGFGYRGWYNEGLQFDLSKGVRLQTISGHNGSTWRLYAYPKIYSLVDGVFMDWLDVRCNLGGPTDTSTITLDSGANGVAAVNQVSAGYSVGTSDAWQATNIEIPPGGGSVTVGATVFHSSSGYRLSASVAFALPDGFGATNPLNCVGFSRYWRSSSYGGQVRLNYIWVGTASDAWPWGGF